MTRRRRAHATVAEALEALTGLWERVVRGPRRRALGFGVTLVVTLALFVARIGTMRARLVAVAMMLAALVVVLVVRVAVRRVFRDPERALRRVSRGLDAELAARAVRSLSLLGGEASGTSAELAELHVRRSLAALPEDDVRRGASRVAFVFSVLAFVFAAANVAACVQNPWGVAEGADILVAKNGVAPLGMAWLAEPSMRARPPDYLHREEHAITPYDGALLPRGTLITVRGAPVHSGRRLLLTDGQAQVPFVEDGAGHVVARWPLAESVKLRVVARFGDVVIPDANETPIESIPDSAPIVTLEGAPKQLRLAGDQDASEISVHYEATDDHGLREVHLVLRAGAREERRVLARLDGETKSDRGGYMLRATDPFIKKSHAPIEIRVEAKDNDPITGPKWGSSDAITILPPDVGEAEARRITGLIRARNHFVDSLAWRIAHPVPGEPKEKKAFLDHEAKLVDEGSDILETALTTSYAGIRVPGRLAAMLRGRVRKLKEAVGNQARSPSTAAHAAVMKANERTVLVLDAAIRGMGLRDARDVSKELADVAEDLALAATLAQKPPEKQRGEQRMNASVTVLEGGGRSLRAMGSLGRDIGEIVEMDLSRVSRARHGDDLPHASLAATDLATRLRQPDPSFGARGGRPSHAGGESGGGRGTQGAGEDGEGSDAEQAFNEAAQEIQKLAGDHNGQIGKVEQSLASHSTEDDVKAIAEEAKKHAQKIRDAAKPLPSVGGGSDSWTSKGAAAREHAEQMAKALESGNVADAVQSGRSATGTLDEAKRAAARERWSRSTDANAERTVDDAKNGIESELKWAEEKLEEMKKRAARRAGPELREHGEGEGKLAERAGDIAKKGRDQEMPQEALDALREAERAAHEAARSLREGNADKALERQREAQQKLEAALEALGSEGEGEREGPNEGEAANSHGHAAIPKADQHKGPEEFRRRVIKGLGQPSSGRFKEAVKRYAEGLLR